MFSLTSSTLCSLVLDEEPLGESVNDSLHSINATYFSAFSNELEQGIVIELAYYVAL